VNAAIDPAITCPVRIACMPCRVPESPVAMDGLRVFRMSEALARRGHSVDIVTDRRSAPIERGPRLRLVPLDGVRWSDYDVVKTVFHQGFDTLVATGGGDHPFIISKLGSVVGRQLTPGVHFHGDVRETLYATQQEIAKRSRFVTILTKESIALWTREHGLNPPVLFVPTGVDAEIPPIRSNPVREHGINEPVVLYAGHLYNLTDQPEVNRVWQDRLNRLGRALRRHGLRLVAMGPGATDLLDADAVLHVGAVPADTVWDWQRHASVGVALAQGLVQDNESSKIYYYLRTGLPVVCERQIPNAWIVEHTGHGAVTSYDDVDEMADAAAKLVADRPARPDVIEWVIRQHSWDARAARYDAVLQTAAIEAQQRRPSGMLNTTPAAAERARFTQVEAAGHD
jgi:glycosyltransferase involved in cell wall biosynthesis